MNKVAIIGGGAAGLMAALTAARAGADVTVYEHNKSVGKKILASGNGRCNIINTTATADDYFGADPGFSAYALQQMPFKTFEKFCQSIGLLLDIKEDGRCYPLSNEAKSVVLAFQTAVEEAGVKIITEKRVSRIAKEGKQFIIESDQEKAAYDKVLIATGSEAAPQLGATADGYEFAKTFGHAIETPYPSLVQLHLDSTIHHKMAGVKTLAEVTLYLNGKPEEKVQGDILFTRYGISGLAILDVSQKASSALIAYQQVSVGINLLPRFNRQALGSLLEKLFASVPKHTLETALAGIISTKIVPYILQFFFKIPMPLSVIQILSIDLGSDMLPGLALGSEKPEKNIMKRPPVGSSEKILDWEVFKRGYFFIGIIEATAAMVAFISFLLLHGWHYGMVDLNDPLLHSQAMTMTLLGAVSCQLVNVWTMRSWEFSAWSVGWTSNRLLIGTMAMEFIWIWMLLGFEPVQKVFHTAYIPLNELWILLPFPLLLFVVVC